MFDTAYNVRFRRSGFTLVEILIVVAILGILAAITIPAFQGHILEAKESAAKTNLQILRNVIGVYATQHKDIPPGYFDGELIPSFMLYPQLTSYTDIEGSATSTKSQNFPYGPYLKKIPENLFNNKTTIKILADSESFPETADGSFGWIYKPANKTIRLDWPGTDSEGIYYYDY